MAAPAKRARRAAFRLREDELARLRSVCPEERFSHHIAVLAELYRARLRTGIPTEGAIRTRLARLAGRSRRLIETLDALDPLERDALDSPYPDRDGVLRPLPGGSITGPLKAALAALLAQTEAATRGRRVHTGRRRADLERNAARDVLRVFGVFNLPTRKAHLARVLRVVLGAAELRRVERLLPDLK